MDQLIFDFNNMFSLNVGSEHGVEPSELKEMDELVKKAHENFRAVIDNPVNRVNVGLEWVKLPYQDGKNINQIQNLGREIAFKYESVISLGIGGSYLGLKAAQDALCAPYFNEFSGFNKNRPKIYFEGNNLDPESLSVLLKKLNPKKTFVIVISKSGETTETKVAFEVVENWLKKGVGKKFGRQIFAITDPQSGTLRKRIDAEQSKDTLSFKNLSLLKGVGGRFSEFNMGLLHLAIVGISIKEVLSGAGAMEKRCSLGSLYTNPAYMYAVLHTIMYRKKNKSISILMPFSEMLKSTADWYSQLLAESLGKKYGRKINIDSDGSISWINDKTRVVNVGRTPVPARGTNDLHSIQQNNIEGEYDKVVTFIKVEKFKNDIKLPKSEDIFSGKKYSELLSLAQEATEWALVMEKRPNCTIIMPKITPFHWGELLFFFEMATAFEGELLDINAFDQPGVEGYKNYMYFKLKKPGLSPLIANEIKNNPLVKMKEFYL
ncbi:MAG: glucose-6-phosphate isomerase [bacterium]